MKFSIALISLLMSLNTFAAECGPGEMMTVKPGGELQCQVLCAPGEVITVKPGGVLQ